MKNRIMWHLHTTLQNKFISSSHKGTFSAHEQVEKTVFSQKVSSLLTTVVVRRCGRKEVVLLRVLLHHHEFKQKTRKKRKLEFPFHKFNTQIVCVQDRVLKVYPRLAFVASRFYYFTVQRSLFIWWVIKGSWKHSLNYDVDVIPVYGREMAIVDSECKRNILLLCNFLKWNGSMSITTRDENENQCGCDDAEKNTINYHGTAFLWRDGEILCLWSSWPCDDDDGD